MTFTILDESFGESEVYNEDGVGILPNPHEEVIGFDISMQDVFLMQELNSIQHLLAHLQHRL